MRGRPKQSALSPEQIATFAPRLRPQYAAVLYLSGDLSYEGIAADLNISIGTVKSRLSRAREQIARFIKEDADANAGDT